MRCLVCHASSADPSGRCPQCGYDASGPEAKDPARIQAARHAFRERSTAYDPGSRVSLRDKLTPWIGVVLGFLLFVLWLKTCRGQLF